MTVSVGIALNAMQVQVVWPEVQLLVEEHGADWLEIVDLRDVYIQVLDGKLDLWLANERLELLGVLFCSWERHAKRSFYHLNYGCGKELQSFMKEGLKKIEGYAALSGASEVVLGGRLGWERMLTRLGYAQKFVELRKSVRNYLQ